MIRAMTMLVLTLCISGYATAREPVRSMLEQREATVVRQNFDLSCGAAALSTILQHQHGLPIGEREIVLELLERPEYRDMPERIRQQRGFSLLDLKRFVAKRGLSGDGYGRLEFTDLEALGPAIVPVRIDGYDHFVVFRGTRADRVLVADPAWGNRSFTRARFQQVWTDFEEFGRVGFAVHDGSGSASRSALDAVTDDFTLLR